LFKYFEINKLFYLKLIKNYLLKFEGTEKP